MKNKYDIVIVGSGIGGLVSAALLSGHGKSVLIIEKEPGPGGYLTDFKRENYVFDVSLHLLNGCGEGDYVRDIFNKCNILESLTFLKPKYLYRSVFPDFDLSIPQTDIDGCKKLLKSHFPISSKGIDSLFYEMNNIFQIVNNRNTTPSLLPYLKNSFDRMVSQHISDDKLKAVISQLWLYLGLPPSMVRAADFCYPLLDYMHGGGYYLEKGSNEVVKALVSRIQSNGGEFIFNQAADKIVIENGKCQKVVAGEEEIYCDAVISNIDINKTVFDLVGGSNFSATAVDKFSRIIPSISAFEIFLGIDIDMKKDHIDDYEVFINSDYDPDRQYQASLDNDARTAPFVITINSNVNRFSAPEGKSVITIIMLAGFKYWATLSKKDYQDSKERIADILIERLCKVMPEIKAHIKQKIISTPLTFNRYTNNADGAIYGYSGTIGRGTEVRPNDICNIKNLYFVSAWSKQGSGVAKVLYSADSISKKIINTYAEV